MAPSPLAFEYVTDTSDLRAMPELQRETIDDSDLAMMENAYQSASIDVGPGEEVDVFSKYLDSYIMSRGTAAEKRAKLFRLVDHYYDYSHDRARVLREKCELAREARGRTGDMDVDEAPEESELRRELDQLTAWAHECQTWDLLRRVLPLRYRESGATHRRQADTIPSSRREYWNDFMLSDSRARERKTVLEWLQYNANNGPDIDDLVKELQQNADRGDIVAHGWLHTRSAIKQQKRIMGTSEVLTPEAVDAAGALFGANKAPMVTQLDPDAMRRQGCRLAPQDEFFERSIWLGCFQLLRRGKSMADIRDWCIERTEAWRAVTIAPLPLSAGEDEDWPEYDPVQTILWRRACFTVAREGGSDDYERAVYGLLSGDITTVEKVCKTWDDFIFVHYSALLRSQFDSYLVKCCPGEETTAVCQSFPSFNALQLHGDPASLATRLVASLETNEITRREALTPIKALQGAIISNNLDNFFYQQGIVLAYAANQGGKSRLMPDFGLSPTQPISPKYVDLGNHNCIRILTHVLIILTLLDELEGSERDPASLGPLSQRHQVQEHLIAAYSSYLRLSDMAHLVPLYASKLIGPRRYANMSGNLIHLSTKDAKILHVNIMQRLGLDVEAFVKYQPNFYLRELNDQPGVCPAKATFRILADGPPKLKYGREIKPDFVGGEDEDALDREDDILIRSMEWLMLLPDLVVDSCTYGIKIYKYFFKHAHLNAAKMFASRVRLEELIANAAGTPIEIENENREPDPSWFEELFGAKGPYARQTLPSGDDTLGESSIPMAQIRPIARTFWELECLAMSLETIDTISVLVTIQKDIVVQKEKLRLDPNKDKDKEKEIQAQEKKLARELNKSIDFLKGVMKPLLKDWLLHTIEDDEDYALLRETYLPDVVIAYVSCLQFAGTTLSRDNLLEAMELASFIADRQSDIARVFVKASRMKELVESFTMCSKALAIWTSDKKATQTASKKMRGTGWSRELWSVKQ